MEATKEVARPTCVCGAVLLAHQGKGRKARYCSRRCKHVVQNERVKARRRANPRPRRKPAPRISRETVPCAGPGCARTVTRRVTQTDVRFCSRACVYASMRADPEARRANKAKADRRHCRKRRAIKRSLPAEPYRDEDIFERDGWRCALCGKRIDRALRWPHPMSATIDHIVPITKGGADTRRNVQAAHARCNTAKSNRLAGGRGDQLLLIG